MTITLFDIPNRTPGVAWSPNTLKARIALNYKGLDFQTEWVEYPDIERKIQAVGGKPAMQRPDGSGVDLYTLPVIHDSETGEVVSDSFDIAMYLDENYPERPLLFPGNSKAAIAVFLDFFTKNIADHIAPFMIPLSCLELNSPSQEYYRRTKEAWYNVKFEEWCPVGPKREEAWAQVKAGLSSLASFLDKNGNKKPFFFGDTFSFADAIVVARLVWVTMYVSDKEKDTLLSWNNGHWDELLAASKVYCFGS